MKGIVQHVCINYYVLLHCVTSAKKQMACLRERGPVHLSIKAKRQSYFIMFQYEAYSNGIT